MSYKVIDLEISGKTTYNKFCNPLDPNNEVTVFACKRANEAPFTIEDFESDLRPSLSLNLSNVKYLIGQNFKFDLLYLWENKELQEWIKQGGNVWDTKTVEYLLRAQEMGGLDLDTLAKQYGGEVKDDRIKTMYEAGMTSKEIPRDLLIPYALGDVVNTELVAKHQAKQVRKEGMTGLVQAYMDHYLALCEIEYNGMHFNKELALQKAEEINSQIQELIAENQVWFGGLVQEYHDYIPQEFTFTDRQISSVLFGGEISIKEDVPALDEDGNEQYYKGGKKQGQLKTRKENVIYKITGLGAPSWFSTRTKNGDYQVDEKTLKKIQENTDDELIKTFIKAVLEYRSLKKLLSTYYVSDVEEYKKGNLKKCKGLLPLVQPDGCIHSEYNTAVTVTGRLSSSNPNGQNLSGDCVDIFDSRWGDEGVIVEIDFSQLEIVVQAWLSDCKNMLKDIQDGVDFHCKRLGYALDLPYTEVYHKYKIENCLETALKRKKIAKPISFQKSYDAQPESISRDTGIPLEIVQKVFAKEDEEYPEIPIYKQMLMEEVKASRIPTSELQLMTPTLNRGDKTLPYGFYKCPQGFIWNKGEFRAYGTYRTVTGKKYKFYEKAKLCKNDTVFRYFPATAVGNYAIQGTAADIVAMQVGRVFREYAIHHRDTMRMVNEIHDSLILDVKKSHVEIHVPIIKQIMEDVKGSFKKYFGINFAAPIRCDVGIGSNWKEAKENE